MFPKRHRPFCVFRAFRGLCLLSLAMLGVACPTQHANFEIAVYEVKADNVSKVPISGARVLLEEQGAEHSAEEYTNEAGLAELEVVVDDTEVKTFFVTVEKVGFKTIVTNMTVNPSFTNEEEFFVPRED